MEPIIHPPPPPPPIGRLPFFYDSPCDGWCDRTIVLMRWGSIEAEDLRMGGGPPGQPHLRDSVARVTIVLRLMMNNGSKWVATETWELYMNRCLCRLGQAVWYLPHIDQGASWFCVSVNLFSVVNVVNYSCLIIKSGDIDTWCSIGNHVDCHI